MFCLLGVFFFFFGIPREDHFRFTEALVLLNTLELILIFNLFQNYRIRWVKFYTKPLHNFPSDDLFCGFMKGNAQRISEREFNKCSDRSMGSETCRPFRKLWRTNQPTDDGWTDGLIGKFHFQWLYHTISLSEMLLDNNNIRM